MHYLTKDHVLYELNQIIIMMDKTNIPSPIQDRPRPISQYHIPSKLLTPADLHL